jgi:hypothetical protein
MPHLIEVFVRTSIRPSKVRNLTTGFNVVAAELKSWGQPMSKLSQQFSQNSKQVGEAEKRLAIQRTFVERLRASGKETKAAEQALEVMRDILRELYNSRSLLRRRVKTVNGAAASPPAAKKAWANRKLNSRNGERPSKRHGGDGGELPGQ